MVAPPFAQALAGGFLIGLAATMLMWTTGRIAGISGISFGLLTPRPGDSAWRLAFLMGLLVAGIAGHLLVPGSIGFASGRSLVHLAIGGVVMGFGARLANGCTSGHGVCGVGRASRRSLVATVTFMATASLTATLFGMWVRS